MAKFYGKRIVSGKMTLDEVPERWKEETAQWLEDNGYGEKETI